MPLVWHLNGKKSGTPLYIQRKRKGSPRADVVTRRGALAELRGGGGRMQLNSPVDEQIVLFRETTTLPGTLDGGLIVDPRDFTPGGADWTTPPPNPPGSSMGGPLVVETDVAGVQNPYDAQVDVDGLVDDSAISRLGIYKSFSDFDLTPENWVFSMWMKLPSGNSLGGEPPTTASKLRLQNFGAPNNFIDVRFAWDADGVPGLDPGDIDNGLNGNPGAGAINWGGGWYRLFVTTTPSIGAANPFTISVWPCGVTATQTGWVWAFGAVMEPGDFPSEPEEVQESVTVSATFQRKGQGQARTARGVGQVRGNGGVLEILALSRTGGGTGRTSSAVRLNQRDGLQVGPGLGVL